MHVRGRSASKSIQNIQEKATATYIYAHGVVRKADDKALRLSAESTSTSRKRVLAHSVRLAVMRSLVFDHHLSPNQLSFLEQQRFRT